MRRHVGGPAVMVSQLLSLIERGTASHVTLRFLPFAAGRRAETGGSLTPYPVANERLVAYEEGKPIRHDHDRRGRSHEAPGVLRSAHGHGFLAPGLRGVDPSGMGGLDAMRTAADPSTAVWRKGSYSNQDGGVCVEVADGVPGVVPVRDSKDPQGPALVFPSHAWTAFISDLGAGGLRPGGVSAQPLPGVRSAVPGRVQRRERVTVAGESRGRRERSPLSGGTEHDGDRRHRWRPPDRARLDG